MNRTLANPTSRIDLSFRKYLEERQGRLDKHWVDGTPDYAFPLDKRIRRKLNAIPPLRQAARAAASMATAVERELQNMGSVAVGPKQFPKIYAAGEHCARILGIGLPQIYIKSAPSFNGYTMATDDREPFIVVHSSLVNAFSEEELVFVIGHECGHIHNLHAIYNVIAEILANGTLMGLSGVLGVGLQAIRLLGAAFGLLLSTWARSGEVTCDRAGLICCGNPRAALYALAKLAAGAGSKFKDFNLDAYLEQLAAVQATPVRFLEVTSTHPIVVRRIAALREFSRCETLFSWRPELRR